jgi:hypothetical protein
MSLKYSVPMVGVILAIGANAGTVYVGGASGLTYNYITNSGTTTSNLGNTAGTPWQERGYDVSLFNGATIAGATSNGSTSIPTANVAPTGPGNLITDNNLGISYELINDGMGSASNNNTGNVNNVWEAAGSAPGTLTVPINVADPTLVGIMLNDIWGYAGNDPTITFTFLTAGNVNVVLGDAANGTGPLRSSTDCLTATGGVTCPGTIAGGHTISASTPITSTTNPGGITTINSGISVTTSTIWSGTYSNVATVGPFHTSTGGNSTGDVMLDDLVFNLGAYSGDTLESISFATPAATGNNVSRLALSAITIQTTPEPSTVLLFASGLIGLFAFRRLRRA